MHPATAAKLPALVGMMEARLRPATAPEFAVVIDRLVAFCRAFGLEGDPAEQVAFWRESVRVLPARIVEQGINDLCRTWKWRRIPLPADLAAACEPHIAERRALLNRAKWAQRKAGYRQPDPHPSELADPDKVSELVRTLERAFATEAA